MTEDEFNQELEIIIEGENFNLKNAKAKQLTVLKNATALNYYWAEKYEKRYHKLKIGFGVLTFVGLGVAVLSKNFDEAQRIATFAIGSASSIFSAIGFFVSNKLKEKATSEMELMDELMDAIEEEIDERKSKADIFPEFYQNEIEILQDELQIES